MVSNHSAQHWYQYLKLLGVVPTDNRVKAKSTRVQFLQIFDNNTVTDLKQPHLYIMSRYCYSTVILESICGLGPMQLGKREGNLVRMLSNPSINWLSWHSGDKLPPQRTHLHPLDVPKRQSLFQFICSSCLVYVNFPNLWLCCINL